MSMSMSLAARRRAGFCHNDGAKGEDRGVHTDAHPNTLRCPDKMTDTPRELTLEAVTRVSSAALTHWIHQRRPRIIGERMPLHGAMHCNNVSIQP